MLCYSAHQWEAECDCGLWVGQGHSQPTDPGQVGKSIGWAMWLMLGSYFHSTLYSLFLKSVTMYHLTRLTSRRKYGCLDWKTDYIAWIRVPTKWEVHFKVYLCKRGENWPTRCWLKIFNSQAIQLPCAIILRVISLPIPLLYWIRVFLLSCVAPSDIIKLNFEGVVMG